jgi:cation diffusion facilitator family transporter
MSGLITFAITSTASIYIGVGRLLNPQTVDNPLIAVATLSFAVISNGYSTTLSYRRLIGKKGVRDIWEIFKHSSIVETKSTFILDLTGTLSAFIGLISIIFYAVTGDVRFDGVGAIAIGLVMAFLSFTLLRNIKDLIIGQSAPEETEKRIRKVVKKIPEVTSVIDLRTIYIGPSKLLVSLEVNLKDHLTTDEIEEITDKIQRRIKKNVPHVHDTQVELESPKTPESKEEKS